MNCQCIYSLNPLTFLLHFFGILYTAIHFPIILVLPIQVEKNLQIQVVDHPQKIEALNWTGEAINPSVQLELLNHARNYIFNKMTKLAFHFLTMCREGG